MGCSIRHRYLCLALLVGSLSGSILAADADRSAEFRRLPISEYLDKMEAGWLGQMAGVAVGGPTEFKWLGQIIPADQVPAWRPEMINQFHQDDLYVEMTFLRTLELYGFDVSIRQAGIDFANSRYKLWHANLAGRDNLRAGIAPPDSGHPRFNPHADDIDYQIEADFSGLIAPGMPKLVIELGEKFGRLMNYGDGLYAGQFVGGMYAEAFFETDPVKLVEAGLRCIPERSQYAEMVRDVLGWYRDHPDDWKKTWELIERKYQQNPDYRRFSCSGPNADFNIDAKINGAYILVGLLYGQGDLDQTILISTRCGQDSDCNPSNAAGVLFTTLGRAKLPERFVSGIEPNGKFSHTEYTFPRLIEVCGQLVRSAVERSGGRIERDAEGNEILVIPMQEVQPSAPQQSWDPGPIAGSRFTEEEMAQIIRPAQALQPALDLVFPGWKLQYCGPDMQPGRRAEYRGRKHVFMTHPLNRQVGAVLSRTVDLPSGKKATLRTVVANDDQGDWVLIVKADGQLLLEKPINQQTTEGGWATVEVDLSGWAGKQVELELVNQPDGWSWEAGYWAEITIR
jgi:hypothetical protein